MNFINLCKKILSFIYPNKCIYCKNIIEYDKTICGKCISSIRGKSKLIKISAENFPHTLCVSAFKYDDYVKSAIWQFKFHGMQYYAESFSEEMYIGVSDYFKDVNFSYISCVPLHESKLKKRGYNQSELLARFLTKKLNANFVPILIKNKNNLTQHELSFSKREENIKGVYSINHNIYIDKSKNLLLCDDIITTGNTLKECIKTLKENGFNNIYCVTLAYV
ncbi:MAG: hypothetical protein LBR79_02180 [Oscillospiraceae bacterium]|nr:hypothetical protein [Oscillospiraceae bacterium]